MHGLLDNYAQGNALRRTDPRLKLFVGLVSVITCALSTSIAAPMIVMGATGFATVYLAKIPSKFYLKLLAVPLAFAALSSTIVALVHGTGPMIFQFFFGLGIRTDGLDLAALLMARTLGGMSAMFFIALTTPMTEIISLAQSLGLPEVVVDLSMLIYRYIFVLMDQALTIHDAQVTRLGYSGFKPSLRSFSMLSSVLFLRALDQGEMLIIAMDSRCYNGKLEAPGAMARSGQGVAALSLIYAAAVMVIAFLTRDLHLL